MSDAKHRRAQYEATDEGDQHFRAKQRVAAILRRCGFYTEVERRHDISIEGLSDDVELRSDVWGVTPQRTICIEVDGPGYHKSAQSYRRDQAKKREICKKYALNPDEDYKTFSYKVILGFRGKPRRVEAWTDKEIAEELMIEETLDKPKRQWI